MTERVRADYRPIYRALKEHNFAHYRKCIEAGEGVSLNHNLGRKAAADVEIAVVYAVVDALKLPIDRTVKGEADG